MNEPKTVVCKGLFGEAVEVSTDQLTFRPGVYGLLFKDDTILLTRAWDGWDFPGGGIDKGEPILDALVREFREETGLVVLPEKLVEVRDNLFQPRFDPELHWHSFLIYYTCSYVSGEISTEGFMEHEKEYMAAAEWVPIKDVGNLKFYNPVDSAEIIRLAAALPRV